MAPNAGSSMSGSGSAARAIRSGSASSSVSIIAPAFLSDQGNEADAAKALFRGRAVGSLRHFDQFLSAVRVADRHHEPSAGCKLVDERRRDMATAGGRE